MFGRPQGRSHRRRLVDLPAKREAVRALVPVNCVPVQSAGDEAASTRLATVWAGLEKGASEGCGR
jgi:hypothetical protein